MAESQKFLAICQKSIPTIEHNFTHKRFRKWLKPCFFAGVLALLITGVFFNKSTSHKESWPIYLSRSQTYTVGHSCSASALCQGEETKEYPNIFSVQNNSLAAVSSPSLISNYVLASHIGSQSGVDGFGGSDGTGVREYVVQEGDTVSSIAQKFNISTETVLWANDLSKKSVINPGDKLIILPVTGAMHVVRKGDTLSQIAQEYKVKEEDIVAFNHLSEEEKIFIGDILIIPGGQKPVGRNVRSQYIPLPNSYFISPIPSPYHITQGLHWYNAVDLSTGKCGSPVYAAAGGRVQRTGYDRYRAGNYVRILHSNGVVTFYGHLSKIAVRAGEKVSQGTVIGYIGHTGHTIPAGPRGCHLHFDVIGAVNPFAK